MNYLRDEIAMQENAPAYNEEVGGVRRAVDRLAHEAERLAKAVLVHAEKIEPALNPSQPEPGLADGQKRDGHGSSLTTRLHAIADDFESRRAELESLTRRLDL